MQLWQRTAVELAAMVAEGSTTSTAVVAAHLARVEEVEGGAAPVNAVVRVLAEEALAAAGRADAAVAAGDPLGPLHGVPCSVKENVDVAGTPTTQGTHVLAEAIARTDAPVVERLRAAGAIPLARTNMPDLGLRVTTEGSLHGTTANPRDRTRSAGGSSGGEGAALATGMSPIGIGNDLGGSLRNPAHCCGVASIKPGAGVVPSAASLPPLDPALAFQLMAVQGVMARTVEDVRTGLLAVAGQHPRDPRSSAVALAPHDATRSLRVALLPEPPGGATHPGVADAVRRAGQALADAGHRVEEAVPPRYEEALRLWTAVLAPDLHAQLPALRRAMGEDARSMMDRWAEVTPTQDAGEVHATHVARHGVAREWAAWHTTHDVLVQPVWSHPAPPHGFDLPGADRGGAPHMGELFRAVLPANLLGTPAAAVPVGLVDGLPVAVQVMGPSASELVCLGVAAQLEDALWDPAPVDPVP